MTPWDRKNFWLQKYIEIRSWRRKYPDDQPEYVQWLIEQCEEQLRLANEELTKGKVYDQN